MTGLSSPVAASGAVRVFGVTLVGVSSTTGVKLLLTLGLVLAVLVVRRLVLAPARAVLRGRSGDPRRFWARQGIHVVTAAVLVPGTVSIWITPGTDVTAGLGLISAGWAFVLQRFILDAQCRVSPSVTSLSAERTSLPLSAQPPPAPVERGA